MAEIVLPTSFTFGEGSGVNQKTFDLAFSSETNGSTQTRLLGPPRWTLTLMQPSIMDLDMAGKWQSLTVRLRGRVNYLKAYSPAKRWPRGNFRGTPTTAAIAIGATSMVVSGVTSPSAATPSIEEGDMLQIGTGVGTSQLVMVTADATLTGGTGTIQFEPPARIAFGAATSVFWDHPCAYYKQPQGGPQWKTVYDGEFVNGMAFDLLETFTA
jgi:hypothetical protein